MQHTDPNGAISPLLDALSSELELNKDKLVSFARPRLGPNPKYDGRQATAMDLEIDYELVSLMFAILSVVTEGRAA